MLVVLSLAWDACAGVHLGCGVGVEEELNVSHTYPSIPHLPRTPPPSPALLCPGQWESQASCSSAVGKEARAGAPREPGREGSGEGEGTEIHKEDLLGRSDAQRRLMKQIPRWVSEQLPKSLFAFKFPQGGGRLV